MFFFFLFYFVQPDVEVNPIVPVNTSASTASALPCVRQTAAVVAQKLNVMVATIKPYANVRPE